MLIGVCERTDTFHQRVGIAAKLTAKSNSELPERNGHIAAAGLGACYLCHRHLPDGFGVAGAEDLRVEEPPAAWSCARMAGVMSIVGVV
jgi:hypothetical protein